jgi:hypothetical protein
VGFFEISSDVKVTTNVLKIEQLKNVEKRHVLGAAKRQDSN